MQKTSTKSVDILLETERLLLRRPQPSDQPHLEQIFCDPEMMRYLGKAWTPEQTAEVLKEWRQDWGISNRWTGVLVRKDTLEPIGTAGITQDTLPDESGFELSWFVLTRQQQQGFASEITMALLHLAFEHLGAKRVVVETHPENVPANKLLKKLGFICLGERQHKYDYLPGFDVQVLWEYYEISQLQNY